MTKNDFSSVKLCDFGLAFTLNSSELVEVEDRPFVSLAGSVSYVAPEVLDQQPYGKVIDRLKIPKFVARGYLVLWSVNVYDFVRRSASCVQGWATI